MHVCNNVPPRHVHVLSCLFFTFTVSYIFSFRCRAVLSIQRF